MKVNQIYYNNNALIDLTDATASEREILKDAVAYGADGERIIGTNYTTALFPIEYDYKIGYIEGSTWIYKDPANTCTDIYEVKAGHRYFISLGKNIGTRFRAMFCYSDIRGRTTDLLGETIIYENIPVPYQNVVQVPSLDGYLLVSKDHTNQTGLISYVYDTTSWI